MPVGTPYPCGGCGKYTLNRVRGTKKRYWAYRCGDCPAGLKASPPEECYARPPGWEVHMAYLEGMYAAAEKLGEFKALKAGLITSVSQLKKGPIRDEN